MKDFGIFINQDPWKSFKRFVWKLDENYICRLGGVQLLMDRDQKLAINPVYYPLFSYLAKPGSKELTFYSGMKSIVFLWNNGSFYVFKNTVKEEEDSD